MRRWLYFACVLIAGVLSAARFFYLAADFPNDSPWMIDQAKFTDEGWWASAAIAQRLTGHWIVAGDYNPGIALPVWPLLLNAVFHLTGVSVVVARALNVSISIATLGLVFLLVRRFTSEKATALVAVLLLSASPFAFAFSRLAILDTLIVFEFCAAMLAASSLSSRRVEILAVLAILMTVMALTKTTSVLLAPAIGWVAWSAMERKWAGLWRVLLWLGAVPAILIKSYAAMVSALGYSNDYRYFFDVNAMPDIDWQRTLGTLHTLFESCFWIDRTLYPLGLLILVLTVVWKREIWANPLFAASWIALAAQAAFIFRRQDDYAPRYFLVMLPPLIWVVTLTFDRLREQSRKTAALLLVLLMVSVIANTAMIGQLFANRTYDFENAARSIRTIVRGHPEQKQLLLGTSGDQISLMTGIPAINDGYGTEDLAEKLSHSEPGWFLAWKDVAQEPDPALGAYRLDKMASYPVFDDEDRNVLTLYKMVRK